MDDRSPQMEAKQTACQLCKHRLPHRGSLVPCDGSF